MPRTPQIRSEGCVFRERDHETNILTPGVNLDVWGTHEETKSLLAVGQL
jgi:hypothetical protein